MHIGWFGGHFEEEVSATVVILPRDLVNSVDHTVLADYRNSVAATWNPAAGRTVNTADYDPEGRLTLRDPTGNVVCSERASAAVCAGCKENAGESRPKQSRAVTTAAMRRPTQKRARRATAGLRVIPSQYRDMVCLLSVIQLGACHFCYH